MTVLVSDHMVVRFTNIYAISAYPPLPLCVRTPLSRGVLDATLCDKVSDLRQVGGFLLVLWFPPPIKLTTTA